MISLILKISESKISKGIKDIPWDFKFRLFHKWKLVNRVVIGPRRLGKTTYLYSLAKKQPHKTLMIDFGSSYFFEIDFQKGGEKLNHFKKSLLDIFDSQKINLVLFDEIQLLSNWSEFLKSLVDDYPNIIFVATGSDAETLNASGESGVGRFKINYVSPLTFYEVSNMKPNISIDEYINNHSFPDLIQNDLDMKYQMIYEKQFINKKFYHLAISNIIRIISLNPGSKINRNNLVKQIKNSSDIKADSKQVNKIINYLLQSQLLYSISDIKSNIRARNENVYSLYPVDWLTYKFFNEVPFNKLNSNSIPRPGFVFENMVISNVLAFFNSPNKRNKIFNKIDNPDLDLIIDNQNYEIKSVDIFKNEKKDKWLEKAVNTNSKIIHRGISTIFKINKLQSVELINIKDFLLNKSLIEKFSDS